MRAHRGRDGGRLSPRARTPTAVRDTPARSREWHEDGAVSSREVELHRAGPRRVRGGAGTPSSKSACPCSETPATRPGVEHEALRAQGEPQVEEQARRVDMCCGEPPFVEATPTSHSPTVSQLPCRTASSPSRQSRTVNARTAPSPIASPSRSTASTPPWPGDRAWPFASLSTLTSPTVARTTGRSSLVRSTRTWRWRQRT